jgi:protein transport protein SEC31
LSLSWCPHDNELLLSCGKDNRSICWNPQTGDSYGEIAVAKNWSFQTSWNSRNPNILASASFDGKIEIQSIQTTLSDDDVSSESRIKSSDDKDFFNIAQAHPLGSRFILPRAPKWMQRPCGAVFGFGGKVAKFGLARKTGVSVHSSIRILQFAVDIEVSACTEAFEELLNSGNLKSICKARSEDATENSEKSDWKTIEALTLDNPRKEIIAYLGFSSADDPGTLIIDAAEEKGSVSKYKNGSEAVKKDPLSAPFDIDHDEGIFLSKLDTSQGAKISDPFRIYSGSETESEREITRALLLGQFDQALDVCLREGNLSDAFMIAICGGETCIAKVQKSYFRQKSEGPSYLRLLASVVNKNLWDFVYNADISDWKELMTVLCTYAGAEEFSDLCEALGDRLESQMKTSNKAANVRSDAAFCYLAGSKLEKVISMWISELERPYELPEVTYPSQSNFSLYARLLQGFIEKVTVFRKVINFEDGELFTSGGWKLNKLYDKYIEYANMVASCGQLHIAQRYLALVPEQYPPANFARDRVKKALRGPSIGEESGFTPNTNKFPPQVSSLKGLQDHKVVAERSVSVLQNSFPKETTVQSKYPVNQLSDGFYQQKNMNSVVYQRSHESQKQPHAYGGPAQPNLPRDGHELIPTSQNPDKSPFTLTPTQASTTSNWNDTPESFFRPPTSRRGTPGINVGSLPNSLTNPNAFDRPISGSQIRSINQLGPPPKGVGVPPARINSPSIPVSQSVQPPPKYASTISGVYMPSQSASSAEPVRQNAPLPRGASPYQSSPTSLPPSNRYAPAPLLNSAASLARPGPAMMSGTNRPGPLPPNPYVSQGTVSLQHKNGPGHDGAASSNASMAGPSSLNFEPNRGPPDLPVQPSRPGPPSVQQPNVPSLPPPKYRKYVVKLSSFLLILCSSW